MSLLDRYARLPVTERRTKSVGSKLEPSLYKAFVEHCTKRGLTTSEALRYIIMEIIEEEKTSSNQEYQRLTDSNKEEHYSNVVVTGGTEKKTKVNEPAIKRKKKVNDVGRWTVNNQLYCPICNKWGLRKNYNRHSKTHGFNTGYELIQAHMETVEKMVQEKKTEQ